MIVWINARLHVACDRCHHRWPAEGHVELAGEHVCESCRAPAATPLAPPARRRRFRRRRVA